MISLYDYLGKAANPEIGKKVHDYTRILKVKKGLRFISNPKYKGKVVLYPTEFLGKFFNV